MNVQSPKGYSKVLGSLVFMRKKEEEQEEKEEDLVLPEAAKNRRAKVWEEI